jgi:hypothetical protein
MIAADSWLYFNMFNDWLAFDANIRAAYLFHSKKYKKCVGPILNNIKHLFTVIYLLMTHD